MKDSTKKLIIWVSVAVIIVGGGVGGYLWYQNRPENNGDEDGDTDDTNKNNTNTGGGTGNTGTGSTGGGTGSAGGAGAGAGAGAGSGASDLSMSNFDKAKKFFGSQARFLGDRIEVKKTQKDFDANWGLGTKEIKIVYYTNGRFFVSIQDVGNNLISGNYLNGGEKLQVTSASGKWSGNKGLIVEDDAISNIKKVLSA